MKQAILLMMCALCVMGLAAHPAWNGWEYYKLKGRVRIIAVTAEMESQEILVFDREGRITRRYSMIYDYAWYGTEPLDEFVDTRAAELAKTWHGVYDDNILITYSYESRDGRIVKRVGKDVFGKVSEQTEFLYENGLLVKSIHKGRNIQVTTDWTHQPARVQTLWLDNQGKVEREEESSFIPSDRFQNGAARYSYDPAGNILSIETPHSDYQSYTSYAYVYFSPIASVTASSNLQAYPIGNLTDFDLATAWVAKSTKDGIGDWVMITLENEPMVKTLEIVPGFDSARKGQDLFTQNNRLKKITLTLSDGSRIEAAFNGKDRKVSIPVNKATAWIKLTINAIYPGSKWRDTCISEVDISTD